MSDYHYSKISYLQNMDNVVINSKDTGWPSNVSTYK